MMFQWDVVNISHDLGGQNVLKTVEMATRHNRWTTRTELERVFCRWIYIQLRSKYCAFGVLTLLIGRQEGHPACEKLEWWDAGMIICLERGADLHMSQLMSLPLTVSCFSKVQIGFTFLVPAHAGSPGQRAVKRVCMSYRWRLPPPPLGSTTVLCMRCGRCCFDGPNHGHRQ